MEPGDVIIDGGNSYYRDDIARASRLRPTGHPLHRLRHQRRRVRPRARLLPDDRRRRRSPSAGSTRSFGRSRPARASRTATPGRTGGATAQHGYLHCGPAGAGHFVKMVHNGIEYGMMAAYAEGLNILHRADVGKRAGADERRDRPAERPGVLPVRHRRARGRRGVAARQRDRLLAARPHGGRAGERPGASRGSRAGYRTPARGAGRSTPRSTRASRRRCCRRRSTSGSALAIATISPTGCCRRCASSSAATTSPPDRRRTGRYRAPWSLGGAIRQSGRSREHRPRS